MMVLDRVWHSGFLLELKSYQVSGLVLGLILSFFHKTGHMAVLDGKSS